MYVSIILCSLITLIGSGCQSLSQTSQAEVYIDSLFTVYRINESERLTFPKLQWEHVDALLAMADSDEDLESYPVNPFSSQSQTRCSQGILALWFVEGVRKGSSIGYPSLNPLCLSQNMDDQDWLQNSEANRAEAAALYRTWWESVRMKPSDTRKKLDPLANSGLYWH